MQIFCPRNKRMGKKVWNVREPKQNEYAENDDVEDVKQDVIKGNDKQINDDNRNKHNENHLPPKKRTKFITANSSAVPLRDITNTFANDKDHDNSIPIVNGGTFKARTLRQQQSKNSPSQSSLGESSFSTSGQLDEDNRSLNIAVHDESTPAQKTRSKSRSNASEDEQIIVFGPSVSYEHGVDTAAATDGQANVSFNNFQACFHNIFLKFFF